MLTRIAGLAVADLGGRYLLRWTGNVAGDGGREVIVGTLSEAMVPAAFLAFAGWKVEVLDLYGGPTISMGAVS